MDVKILKHFIYISLDDYKTCWSLLSLVKSLFSEISRACLNKQLFTLFFNIFICLAAYYFHLRVSHLHFVFVRFSAFPVISPFTVISSAASSNAESDRYFCTTLQRNFHSYNRYNSYNFLKQNKLNKTKWRVFQLPICTPLG